MRASIELTLFTSLIQSCVSIKYQIYAIPNRAKLIKTGENIFFEYTMASLHDNCEQLSCYKQALITFQALPHSITN